MLRLKKRENPHFSTSLRETFVGVSDIKKNHLKKRRV